MVAADRGIEVVEEKRRSSRDFTNLVAVSADDARVAGTTIGNENRHWLVDALGFELEIELAPRMALLRYDDVPGVIGRVGTLFGEAGVNIANMAVSRNREGGKALMAFSIDSAAPAELLARLREGADDVVRDLGLAMSAWPEPVERVAAVLQRRGGRGADRGVPGRHADGDGRGRRGRLRARPDREVARLRLRRRLRRSRSSPATAAPTRPRSRRAVGASEMPDRAPERGRRTRPASSRAASRRSRSVPSRAR